LYSSSGKDVARYIFPVAKRALALLLIRTRVPFRCRSTILTIEVFQLGTFFDWKIDPARLNCRTVTEMVSQPGDRANGRIPRDERLNKRKRKRKRKKRKEKREKRKEKREKRKKLEA
jgi:hypothetical protein